MRERATFQLLTALFEIQKKKFMMFFGMPENTQNKCFPQTISPISSCHRIGVKLPLSHFSKQSPPKRNRQLSPSHFINASYKFMCISCLECISKYWAGAFKIYVFCLGTKMAYGKFQGKWLKILDIRNLTNVGLHFQMINGMFSLCFKHFLKWLN